MISQSRERCTRFSSLPLLFALGVASPLSGQSCPVHPDSMLFPLDAAQGDHFGSSVSVRGDAAIVGMPQGDNAGNATGAAWVMHRDGGSWGLEQKLVAANGSMLDKFGSSVSIDGDVAVVGAPHMITSSGAAYVFRKQNGVWNQEAKLTVGGTINFGASVAVSGNIVVVGDPMRNQPNAQLAGAAHVYKFNGSIWVHQATLAASDPGANDRFGSSVAALGDWIAIGAPFDVFGGGQAGAVYTFHFDFANWMQTQKLTPTDLAGGDHFGWAVGLDTNVIAIGAPGDDQPPAQSVGAAYIFRWLNGVWSQEAKLLAYDGVQNDLMGSAVAISDNMAIAGAPTTYGKAYSFRFDGTTWQNASKLVSGNPVGQGDLFGTAVGLVDGTAMIGAPADQTFSYENGAVFIAPAFPDCNDNGIVDLCEAADCNGNRTPDECDIGSKLSQDCDGDGVPDECQAPVGYQFDDGIADTEWGFTYFPGDLVWLNQFSVVPGREIINFVDIEWGSHAPEGIPVTVMVYDDPNNDANPSDAILLTSVQTRSFEYSSNNNYAFGWARVQIPATFVGSPGDSFFIGARVPTLPETYPALADTTGPSLMRCWTYAAEFGQSDIEHLENNGTPSPTTVSKFMLRAGTSDCNANGIFDGCDILNGTSVDKNGNGIPDECDACRADFVPRGGDGIIGLAELLAVIADWNMPGQGNAPDINADSNINAADLLIVINSWGPCP